MYWNFAQWKIVQAQNIISLDNKEIMETEK